MSAPSATIEVQDLHHRYRHRGQAVLDGVSFSVAAGEAVAVVGRSGCGKSTLLHLLAGLAHPTGGIVRIDGAEVRGPSPRWVMMFQQPSLLPWMTVFQNAALGLRFAGRGREAARVVGGLLAMVGMAGDADANVQRLSGGQQQRVALARSLAAGPSVLLLDEPFSALDAFTRADLQREVRAITRSLGITLVLVTHDIDEAIVMADRALVMAPNPGRIRADLRFGLGDDRGRDDPAVQYQRARLIAALGETVDMPRPGDLYEI